MGCPKCQCEEVSASGMCLWCGYQVTQSAGDSEPNPQEHQVSSDAPAENSAEELPEWRQQLSQRLQSIKQKREVAGSTPEESESSATADSAVPASMKPAESAPSAAGAKPADAENTRKRIDEMTSGQSHRKEVPFGASFSKIPSPKVSDFNKSPMMLLSRTLSGLVDLIIIGLSTGILILAADIFSGIKVLGFGSIVNYTLLFLLIYFLYSLFFFRISSQTIGMMITHLRMVNGVDMERPSVGRILVRCVGYLISLFCLGLGLLWAFFDQEHRCFHDRLTNTRIVRI
jgi:uncharacterized RDD family membrane protein YckC